MAMGMGWGLTMRRVVLPQAVKIVLPPYGNIMIMMLKDSSQASTITVAELALQGRLIASSTFQNTTVFTLVDVHKRFGALEVIKGFSTRVAQGEVVCVIGPSGSGKSTILRCINGLES